MAIIYNGSLDKEGYKAVFGHEMEEIAKSDPEVVYLDADLMSSWGTAGFWKRNPRQAYNIGVAEANMIGIAAGLSAAGKKPYVHTFGPFASRRCYDQLFLSIAYAGNSARVFGTDPGVVAAYNGGTHMPFEELALMRAIPTATVIEISDGAMLKAMMWQTKDKEGLIYIRTGRKNYPTLYSADHQFTIGKGEIVRTGTDATVIACGIMVGEAMQAAESLRAQGINLQVIDMFTIKPIDKELVLQAAKDTGVIVTAENHNVIGGLGDAVADVLVQSDIPCKMRKIGVNDRFGQVGTQDFLQKEYGLTAQNIEETVLALKK